MTKVKLLLITAISPFPKDSGGAVRIYNTIKNLSLKFELHLIFLEHTNYSLNKNDLSFLKQNCRSYHYYPQAPTLDKNSFLKHFQPYWLSGYYSEILISELNSIITKYHINIVQIEFTQLLYLVKYLPKNVKTIFTSHDITSISFIRRLSTFPKLRTKIKFFLRWLEIYFYEKTLLKRFDLVCSVSQHDQEILQTNFHLKHVLNVPNGIEAINFIKKLPKQQYVRLGYIGSFSHPPNETAFIYFLNKIAPLLEKQKISYKFYLAGSNDSKIVQNLIKSSPIKNKSVIVNLGFLPLTSDFYKQIDTLVAPIQSGSGTRIKILESLSFGVPVIASAIGAEGLNFPSTYLQIAYSPKEYLKLIKNTSAIKQNNQHQTQLKKQLNPYLWSNIFKRYAQYVLK